jgi:hypothetical protein
VSRHATATLQSQILKSKAHPFGNILLRWQIQRHEPVGRSAVGSMWVEAKTSSKSNSWWKVLTTVQLFMRANYFVRSALLLALFLGLAFAPAEAASFDHRHTALTSLLTNEVQNGRVNYSSLKANPAALDRYLDALAAVPKADFDQWEENQRLAFLINLYNATTLKLIVDYFPVAGIKDIGGLFGSPWKQKVVRLFGSITTLDAVEHGMIRRDFSEPRIHFALVCAANSCPPLRSEAYVADRLDTKLTDQGRRFLAESQKNRIDVDARVAYLSPIFSWYAADFEKKSGSALNFIEPFLSENARLAVAKGDFKVRFTDYDWSLNDQTKTTTP